MLYNQYLYKKARKSCLFLFKKGLYPNVRNVKKSYSPPSPSYFVLRDKLDLSK